MVELTRESAGAAAQGSSEALSVAAWQSRRAKWESLSLSAMMLIVVAAALLGLWTSSKTAAYAGYQDFLMSVAQAAAASVDTDLHERIRRPEQLNDPDYLRAVEPLRRIKRAVPDVHYIYTLVMSGSQMHFVLDASDPGARTPDGKLDQSGVWEIYPYFSPPLRRVFGDAQHPGIPTASSEPFTDEWGTFMTGFAPLHDASGRQIGVLGVDIDAHKFLARQAASRNRALLGLIPAGVLIAILGFLFYRVRRRGLADAQLAVRSAQEDRLTGLPNRAVFMERLERSLARVRSQQQRSCAVLFFDFDRFKLVNDTLGHEAGDELLRQIGHRLKTALRLGAFRAADEDADVISRFGGDEFLILINHLNDSNEAVRVAERLLNALAPSYRVRGHEVHSMASVGIATSEQGSGSAEELVRNADVAMYEAKHAGRGCSVVFSEAMHARLSRHLAIETSLRRALGSGELCLKYQAVIDLNTGQRRSLEVSVCWNHPTLGTIAPQEFLPIAEESGLLVAIGQWVLEEACTQMVGWRASGAPGVPDTVSINLANSAIALGDRVLEHVRGTLESTGLPPECLQLEVSERAIQQNTDRVGLLFAGLRKLGVKIAMDSFGAGHCSLSILRSHPFDAVKIDRSFLLDLDGSHGSLAVVGAILNLIRNLGLQSVAEGVEDPSQIAILQSLGCHAAQGSIFGGPMLAASVTEPFTVS